jgi:two-component system chemotaxis response regulator CheY
MDRHEAFRPSRASPRANGGIDMENNSSHLSGTVMIVDDELFFRKMLRDILEEKGITVVAEAEDGLETVEKYRQHQPDIIILDIYMPGSSGFEAAREILSYDSNAKVLICSGSGYDEDVEAALSTGARDIILKPFIPKEVLDIVGKLLREKE